MIKKVSSMSIHDAKVMLPTRMKRFRTELALLIMDKVIQKSARLTGRFQYSWRLGVGAADPWAAPRAPQDTPDHYPRPSMAAWRRYLEANDRPGASLHISNNVPYAQLLNSGAHSRQMPRPIIHPAVREAYAQIDPLVRAIRAEGRGKRGA